ncbi:MAG: YfiT family bacillithiol transferase, partial [Gemmatimonadaceae bacterium]
SDAERTAFIERLALLPAHVASAIDGLTDEEFARPYRPGGWTVGQLVHHIADSHANAYVRVKLGLTEDTPTIKPYDQDAWVALADSALDPHVSLMMLTAVHARLVAVVRAMTPAEFRRRLLHPENGPMTLDQLVALYAWHGDHHVAHLEAYKAGRAG